MSARGGLAAVADVVDTAESAGADGAVQCDGYAPVVADGFVVTRDGSDGALRAAVERFASSFGLATYGVVKSVHRGNVAVLGVRSDGALWAGAVGFTHGAPMVAADGTSTERTVTVRAQWVRPAEHSEWVTYVSRRFGPYLESELGRMSVEERAQWAVPVTAKGETVAAFKVAPKCYKRGTSRPAPVPADNRLRFYPADTGAGQAMSGTMRALGAGIGRWVPAATFAPGYGCEGPTLQRSAELVRPAPVVGPVAPVAPVVKRAAAKRPSSAPAPVAPVVVAPTYAALWAAVLTLADNAVNADEATALVSIGRLIETAETAHRKGIQ